MKFEDFPKNIELIFYIFFSKLELVFAASALFHYQVLFLCMSSIRIMNIS